MKSGCTRWPLAMRAGTCDWPAFPSEPRRMKQPAKDVLREQLVVAADELIRLRTENLALRDAAQQATEQLRAAMATN